MTDKLAGSIFDPKVPAIVKVSRVSSAAIISACAMMLYCILTI